MRRRERFFVKDSFVSRYIFTLFIGNLLKFCSLFAFPADADPFLLVSSSVFFLLSSTFGFASFSFVSDLLLGCFCCCCYFFCFRVGCSSSSLLQNSSRIFLHEYCKPSALLYQVHSIFGTTFARQFFW